MPPRGGIRQRAARRREQDENRPSSLATFLTLQVLRGFMSVPVANRIAKHAKRDLEYAAQRGPDFMFNDLDTIAQLGGATGRGKAGRMYQELMSKLVTPSIPLFRAIIPLDLQERVPRMVEQCMLLPHVVFSSMYHHYHASFIKRICPSSETLRDFWTKLERHPLLHNHPVRRIRGWRDRCVPLSIHGDGVPCVAVGKSWGKSMEVLSWASLVVTGSTLQTFFWIYGCFTALFSKTTMRHTVRRQFIYLKWSLQALWEGKWPDHDPFRGPYPPDSPEGRRAGTPLCGNGVEGFFGLPFVIRGDLEWFYSICELADYKSRQPCCWCPANLTNIPWRDMTVDALWRNLTYGIDAWRGHVFPLLSLEFINILTFCADWMHTAHLGIYKYVLGSVLWLLCHDMMTGTPVENMREVMRGLRAYWRANPTESHFQNITISMFAPSEAESGRAVEEEARYPQLKGRAAEIKHLVAALHAVFTAHIPAGGPREEGIVYNQIALMLRECVRADEILDRHPPHRFPALPRDEASQFEEATVLHTCTHRML